MRGTAPTSNQQTVVERLRALESRLNSLSAADHIDLPALRDALAEREQQRGRAYGQALREAGTFALETARAVDARVLERLSKVADRATAQFQETGWELATGEAEARISLQESRVPALIGQFAQLRRSGAELENRLARAGERLDEIWKEQDPSGLGGWRTVMRAVASQVALQKPEKPQRHSSFLLKEEMEEEGRLLSSHLSCPRCKKRSLRRIRHLSVIEEALQLVLVSPYRCTICNERSYHFRYSLRTAE